MERFTKENWKQPVVEHNKLTKWGWMVSYPEGLKLGRLTDIGAFTYIQAKSGVIIEDNVQIGSHCAIYSVNTIDEQEGKVVIEEGACIGSGTVILPSTEIGRGALVGALSLVISGTKIPPGEVWGGVPAKKIKLKSSKGEPIKLERTKRLILGRDVSKEELNQKARSILGQFK